MRWYDFEGQKVLLNLESRVKTEQLPWEADHVNGYMSTCMLGTNPVYRVLGEENQHQLCITFTTGYKDVYAAVAVLYEDNTKAWVHFPCDEEWLSVLRVVAGCQPDGQRFVLESLKHVMQYAVGKKDVSPEDFQYIWRLASVYPLGWYATMKWWLTWFYYACVAEENYVNAFGQPTRLGGLVKIVAFIEYVLEGASLRDACDHYKSGFYRDVYGGVGDSVQAVIEKCKRYGVCR